MKTTNIIKIELDDTERETIQATETILTDICNAYNNCFDGCPFNGNYCPIEGLRIGMENLGISYMEGK